MYSFLCYILKWCFTETPRTRKRPMKLAMIKKRAEKNNWEVNGAGYAVIYPIDESASKIVARCDEPINSELIVEMKRFIPVLISIAFLAEDVINSRFEDGMKHYYTLELTKLLSKLKELENED